MMAACSDANLICDVLFRLQSALDAENAGELRLAIEQYQNACACSVSLMSLWAQSSVNKQVLVGLDGLLQTFSCRMSMLLAGSDAANTSPLTDSSSTDFCDAAAAAAAAIQLPPAEEVPALHVAAASARQAVAAGAPSREEQQPITLNRGGKLDSGQGVLVLQQANGSGLRLPHADHAQTAGEHELASEMRRLCLRTPTGDLEDVIGMRALKEELQEALFMPLQFPDLFTGLRRPPKTFLLHGPPGTGKTLVVEKVAATAGMALLAVSPSTILSKWHGESERSLRALFDAARAMQPTILFLDEVDSLGASRASGEDASVRRLLVELLLQMTRAEQEKGVYVFAATNRLQDCDPALLRRFERRVTVPVAGPQERSAFLTQLLQRCAVAYDVSAEELHELGEATAHYSSSDLVALCRQAALQPVRQLLAEQQRGSKRCKTQAADAGGSGTDAATCSKVNRPVVSSLRPVSFEDFTAAMKRVAATLAEAGVVG